jgi:hypothetical protein
MTILGESGLLMCRMTDRFDGKRKLFPGKKATPPGGDGAARRPERNGQTLSIAHSVR